MVLEKIIEEEGIILSTKEVEEYGIKALLVKELEELGFGNIDIFKRKEYLYLDDTFYDNLDKLWEQETLAKIIYFSKNLNILFIGNRTLGKFYNEVGAITYFLLK